MAEFAPVHTMADLAVQDEDDMSWGYRAGLRGDPEPLGSRYSRAYWHGWRNGRVDGGHAEPDAAQRLLAHAYNSTFGEDALVPVL